MKLAIIEKISKFALWKRTVRGRKYYFLIVDQGALFGIISQKPALIQKSKVFDW
jgi:hypothetical protein